MSNLTEIDKPALLGDIIYGPGADSHNMLSRFTEEVASMDWPFKELLGFYSGLDRPIAQENFELFYNALERTAPPYQGGDMYLFRGTSLETLKEHGAGLCWTTSGEVANQFANLCCSGRYQFMGAIDKTPVVLEDYFDPDEILYCHTNERGEQEVLLKQYCQPHNPTIHTGK